MIATYVNALEYIDLLNQKAQEKKAKERALDDVSYRLAASKPRPVFSIDLPNNMVDLLFHERKSKSVPESQRTTTKPDKNVSRLGSHCTTSGDHKDKTSTKQKTHKTVKIFPGAFDDVSGENIHEIKQDFHTSTSQIRPKPIIVSKEKIEYFKVTHNGHEHLRKRANSANVMVGVNGHPLNGENNIRSGSENSKITEKRIPLSWEDQLSNFPEEVKTVKQKDPVENTPPKNYCENYRFYSEVPTSKLIWRPMIKLPRNPLNHRPNTKHLNPPPEQTLPSSPSIIKSTQLKDDLKHRYMLHENLQGAVIGSKLQSKMENRNSKTLVERAMAARDEVLFKTCNISINQSMNNKTRIINHDIKDQVRTRKTSLEKRQKSYISRMANRKSLPGDPNILGDFFHVRKMASWQLHPSEENKTRKSVESFENPLVPLNNQDQYRSQPSTEKENRFLEISKEAFQVVAFAKPLSIKGGDAKITTQEVQVKGISVKTPSVINFRIPYGGYTNECEILDGSGDHHETDSDRSVEAPRGKWFLEKGDRKTTEFICERPKTI